MATKTAAQRDVTRALALAHQINNYNQTAEAQALLNEQITLLTRMDARTGTRDPSAKKSVKRAAKKARR